MALQNKTFTTAVFNYSLVGRGGAVRGGGERGAQAAAAVAGPGCLVAWARAGTQTHMRAHKRFNVQVPGKFWTLDELREAAPIQLKTM